MFVADSRTVPRKSAVELNEKRKARKNTALSKELRGTKYPARSGRHDRNEREARVVG